MVGKRNRSRRRMSLAWHTLVCLTVLAFVLRAMMPAGFMPDPDALRDGRFQITFCTAAGPLPVDLTDFVKHDHPASGHDAPAATTCPFGVMTAQSLIAAPSAGLQPLVVVAYSIPLPVVDNVALPPSPASGPPLGSRAPPPHLV